MQIENILLTGGCGLVGRTLAPMLQSKYSVTHFEVVDPDDGLPFIKGDLRNPQEVAMACEDMDAVIHVAALHGKAWAELGDDMGFEVNVTGTKNIIEGAVRAGVKRVIFTSSIWASGHGSPPPDYLPIDEKLQREPEAFRRDPAGILDAVVPGVAGLIRSGELSIGPDAEWYTVEKAKHLLGYKPEFNFALT